MEFVSFCVSIFPCLWDHSATQINYLRKLKENMNSLSNSLDKLKEVRNDVTRRVDHDEANPLMKRKSVVAGWLQRVEIQELEVFEILQQASSFLCFCCPKNCCTGYKIGKKVVKKIKIVKELRSEGDLFNFNVVVDRCLPDPIQEIPTNQVMGMDLKLNEIWKLVTEEDQVRILGLYGMGGVGKTTLLKKLNNEFLVIKRDRPRHDFDLVLWVVVSKDVNLENIQKQIGDSIGLSWQLEDRGVNGRATRDIFKVLSKKKFVLLMDDIWERIDLQSIGIPSLDVSYNDERILITNSKVVFTTRSKDVCGSMEADEKIRVECLKWDEAWSLFQKKVGQDALDCDPKIPKLAEIVAKECDGLPLALITIGRSMASKKTPQEWEYAITAMRKSTSEFLGMCDEVFPILKFSYDNLENDKLKSCFLYCSLYPEDYEIQVKELIGLWIAEGFLSEFDDIEEAKNEGHYVIGCLLSACLLESVFDDRDSMLVKMHDVVRDLAIWVASDCGRKKEKFLVVQPSKEPKLDEWEKAERISLDSLINISNSEYELSKTPKCLNLSTLLLQRSIIRTISDDFFTFMPLLKVLNMNFDPRFDQVMPTPSISSLLELEYLKVSNIGRSFTPGWLKCLVKLKYLQLGIATSASGFNIKPGEIACLTKLQMFDSYESSLDNWEVEGGPNLTELEGLTSLNHLGITVTTFHALKTLISSNKLGFYTRRLCIRSVDDIITLALSSSLSSSSINIANMIHLKELSLERCPNLEELRICCVEDHVEEKITTLLTSLKRLTINGMPKLKIVWDTILQPHHQLISCFTILQHVEIVDCGALKDLTWLIYVQGLKSLHLCSMDGLEEVISSDGLFAPPPPSLMQQVAAIFSKLRFLKLVWLQNLKSICVHPLPFPSLESIVIERCRQLKKLPLHTESAKNNTLRRIKGEREWWKNLEWEDEIVKSTFVPYFTSSN